MTKPKITKETLFVTGRSGKANGYGNTPRASFVDFERREGLRRKHDDDINKFKAAVLDRNRRIEALQSKVKALEIETQNLYRTCAARHDYIVKLNDQIAKLTADALPTLEDLDGWVMMAMAYHGTTNAIEAIGLTEQYPTAKENAAARKVQKHMDRWIKKLGPKVHPSPTLPAHAN